MIALRVVLFVPVHVYGTGGTVTHTLDTMGAGVDFAHGSSYCTSLQLHARTGNSTPTLVSPPYGTHPLPPGFALKIIKSSIACTITETGLLRS